MRPRFGRRVQPKDTRKKVAYTLIDQDSTEGIPMYALLGKLRAASHEDLEEARIALAWCTSWKPDVDGRLTLGKCKKASDLDRELAAFDFVILLSKEFWTSLSVTDEQRAALLDHELCHAAPKFDTQTGEPVYDERDRRVWRIRKHDVEEFTAIISRHGTYKRDLERFAAALRLSTQAKLPLEDGKAAKSDTTKKERSGPVATTATAADSARVN